MTLKYEEAKLRIDKTILPTRMFKRNSKEKERNTNEYMENEEKEVYRATRIFFRIYWIKKRNTTIYDEITKREWGQQEQVILSRIKKSR